MHKKNLLNSILAALLTFTALVGSLGCLATGMQLPFRLSHLFWGCALLSLGCCFLLKGKLWFPTLCVGALLLGYVWQEQDLRLSLEALLFRISDLYDKGYGWGILQWSDRTRFPDDLTPALLLLGLPIALSVGLTTRKGQLGFLGVLMPLLPLAACLILKDTVPAEEYLALLLFSVLMLLLTMRVRALDTHRANTLTLTLTLPLTLALALLFTFCPRESYHMQDGAQKLEDWVLNLLDTHAPQESSMIPGDQARVVDLASAGKRHKKGKQVMTVRAQESGSIYLRGCAYDIYDGTSWSATPGWNSWNLFYSTKGGEVKSLDIRTSQPHSVYYFTYVPYAAPAKVLGGRMRNDEGATGYTVYYQDPITYTDEWDQREDAIGGEDLAEYLQLPESTREGALQILTKKVGIPTETINSGQIWKNAIYIADWVSHRAKYDLSTGKMPEGCEDFALWFLNESKTGYCTHYATAAAILLRAAGIPAQYVTGYLVNGEAGRSVTVTEDNAHAWVEVFINGVGWVMLEPTPGGGLEQTLGSTQQNATTPSAPTPTQSTLPHTTEETTAPSTRSTAPTHSSETAPSQDTQAYTHATDTVSTTHRALMGGADPGKPGNPAMKKPLLTLLLALGALLLLIGQWRIRVALQRLLFRRGTPNRRALRLWKALVRACRLLKQSPDADSLLLAQKARFSQHTLTEEELTILQKALADTHRQLKKRPLLLPICTLILALY